MENKSSYNFELETNNNTGQNPWEKKYIDIINVKKQLDKQQVQVDGVIHNFPKNKFELQDDSLWDPNVLPLMRRLKDEKHTYLLNGYHTKTYRNGSKYEGEFWQGKRHGKGKMYRSNGLLEYAGDYKFDIIQGFGQAFYADGSRYEGDFINWQWHGIGTYYDKFNKPIFKGIFEFGKYIGPSKEQIARDRGKQFQRKNELAYGIY